MAETSRLHSSVGCFYSYLRPLGLIHWFVKSMQNDSDFIYLFFFLVRFQEIFYYSGCFDQRCLSCGTISNRVYCYDIGSPCDLDFWDPACRKVRAKMKVSWSMSRTFLSRTLRYYVTKVFLVVVLAAHSNVLVHTQRLRVILSEGRPSYITTLQILWPT